MSGASLGSGIQPTAPPPPSAVFSLAERPFLLLFGDSITQLGSKVEPVGWVSKLQETYSSTYRVGDVLNRGYSGYNTRWALRQLPHLISQTSGVPSLVTVFFGANDAAVPGGKQHVPIQEYQENLEAMVCMLRRAWPSCAVVLITPPPVDEEKWDAWSFAKLNGQGEGTEKRKEKTIETGTSVAASGCGMRELERVRFYAQACSQVAARLECACVELFRCLQERSDWKDCLSDGLHLSATGNLVLYNCVCQVIAEIAPHLKADIAPVHFPLWSDLAEEEAAATEESGKVEGGRVCSTRTHTLSLIPSYTPPPQPPLGGASGALSLPPRQGVAPQHEEEEDGSEISSQHLRHFS